MEFYSGQPDILAASVRDYCTGVLNAQKAEFFLDLAAVPLLEILEAATRDYSMGSQFLRSPKKVQDFRSKSINSTER